MPRQRREPKYVVVPACHVREDIPEAPTVYDEYRPSVRTAWGAETRAAVEYFAYDRGMPVDSILRGVANVTREQVEGWLKEGRQTAPPRVVRNIRRGRPGDET